MYLDFWESIVSAILVLIVAVMCTILLKSMFDSGDAKGALGIVVFKATAISWAGFFILAGMAVVQTASWSINEKIMGVAVTSYVIGMVFLIVADFYFNSEAKLAYNLHQNLESILKKHGVVLEIEIIDLIKKQLVKDMNRNNTFQKWSSRMAYIFIGLTMICSVSTSFFQ